MRGSLRRVADDVVPDVERRLSSTLDRAERRRERMPVALIATATLVLVILVAMPQLSGRPGEVAPSVGDTGVHPGTTAPAVSPDTSRFDAVAGTWRVDLDAGDPGVTELGLAGTWVMTLRGTGAVDLLAPATFAGSRASGHAFSLDGSTFRTDLYYNDYCDTVGSYSWRRSEAGLVFEPVADACAIRIALLGARPWSLDVSGSPKP
jgi:hypothetical protein